jgi:hypothetical protein
MVSDDELKELRAVCRDANAMTDGPLQLVHLADVSVVTSGERETIPEVLICLSPHNG